MGNEAIKEKPSTWQRAFAPFAVLKFEKVYWIWIASYIISFAGIIIDLINHTIKTSIENGMIFSTCIAVLAPLVFEFLTNYIVDNRKGEHEQFSVYKGVATFFCVLGMIVTFLFYGTDLRSSLTVQLICVVLFLAISFYLYLVTKMPTHARLLQDYADIPYNEIEKGNMSRLQDNSEKLEKTTSDGIEVKL